MAKRLPPEVMEFFRKAGRKGGKLGGAAGGKKRAENLTPEQRVEHAKKAAAARWEKKKGK